MIFPANKITHNKHITFDLYHNQNTISFSLLLLLILLFDVRCYDLYIVCVYAIRLSRTQMPTKCNFCVQTKNKNERKCMKTDRRAGVFMQQQQFVIFCTHKKKILSQYLPASQTSICYFFLFALFIIASEYFIQFFGWFGIRICCTQQDYSINWYFYGVSVYLPYNFVFLLYRISVAYALRMAHHHVQASTTVYTVTV